MNRIMIFGLSGSGKTTFANYLSKCLNLPVYHLDRYFFIENWQERNYEEFLSIQQDFVEKDHWIIDGNATRSLEMRWQRADLVIYFRYNRFLCLWRLIKRVFLLDPFQDAPEGCSKSVRWKLIYYMWGFHEERAAAKIKDLRSLYPEADFYEIRKDQDKKDLIKYIRSFKASKAT